MDLFVAVVVADTKADITINNHLALINTKMLREYATIDPRMRHLVLLVKYWAKRRKVNDAYVGTLSSYAYALMCIAHLQRRVPPVLPVLHEMPPTHVKTVGEPWWVEGLKCRVVAVFIGGSLFIGM